MVIQSRNIEIPLIINKGHKDSHDNSSIINIDAEFEFPAADMSPKNALEP